MIEFAQVTRYFGATPAVVDLSLRVARGEVFAFLGPNGAGKTTTLRMLVGLLRPTSGAVKVGDFDVARSPRLTNRQIGYVPDQPLLYDKLTGREFLEFVARMHGQSAGDTRANIDRQTNQFELSPFLDRLTETYSHGMKQRLAFAAALVHLPAVLVLDEPMVGLDPRSMRSVKDLLRRESRAGLTVFMSTHTLPMVEEIADRIGIINRGRLVFVGTVAELRGKFAAREGSLENLYLALTEQESPLP